MTRSRWYLVAVACTVGVLVLCFLPAKHAPDVGVAGLDKLFHTLAFFVIGFSWRRAGLRTRSTLLLGLLLAAGTEIIQASTSGGRSGDVIDAAADLLGIALGAFVAGRFHGS